MKYLTLWSVTVNIFLTTLKEVRKLCMGSRPNLRILRLKGISILKPQQKVTALFDPKFETPPKAKCQKSRFLRPWRSKMRSQHQNIFVTFFLTPIWRTFSDIPIVAARPPTAYLCLGGKAIFDLLKNHQIRHSDCGSKVDQKSWKSTFYIFFLYFKPFPKIL